ncbi:hypothetical protein BD779DRAFT_719761 [Infundibulicybe gibba]|nr:hypothetical protein BD779DRAFT_719761 [Infundibulicybe gibba]
MSFNEFTYGAHRAFRTVVPELQDRKPISWNTIPYSLAYYAPFTFLVYLARRPNTYLLRLLLLPAALAGILGAAYRFVWVIPETNLYNWGQCLFAAVTIGKALECALTKEGMLKVGENRPGEMKGKGVADGTVEPQSSVIPAWLYDTVELAHTMRGLNWKFGRGVHVPRDPRPQQRTPFLRATLSGFVQNYLLLDFLESAIKFFPGVGTPEGGTIFYPSLTPISRYAVSTLIHMMTGTALLAGFHMVYDLLTLFAVGVLHSSPSSWPPVTDDPWSADSMHAFWSKHWHQLLRQTFLVLGGYPGKWIAGDLGMLFGAFAASGLFHECAMYSMGRGFDHTVTIFFTLQGPILILERFWRRFTKRRVCGLYGRLWVYFILFLTAQPLVDAWHRRGLGGGMIIPPFLSPTRLFLVPALQHVLDYYGHRR